MIALSLFKDIYRSYYKQELEPETINKLPTKVNFASQEQAPQILVDLDEKTANALKNLVFAEELQEKRKF